LHRQLNYLGVTILLGLLLVACSASPKVETISDSETEAIIVEIENELVPKAASQEQIVIFEDPSLEKMMREQIDKPEGDITPVDMEMVYSININCDETPVYELDGLEYALNLNDFTYRNGTLKSLDPIGKLKNMGYINISYSKVEAVMQPFETPTLSRISFIETSISDFDFLKNVTTFTNVTISRCGISSIAFMKDWLALETLNISYNKISNIEPIMQLKFLKELTVYEDLDNKIIDRGLLETLVGRGVLVDYNK